MAPQVKAMAASRLEVYAMVAKAVPKTTQKTNLGAGADAGSATIPETSQDFVRSNIVKQSAGETDRYRQKQRETDRNSGEIFVDVSNVAAARKCQICQTAHSQNRSHPSRG